MIGKKISTETRKEAEDSIKRIEKEQNTLSKELMKLLGKERKN